MLNSEVLNGLVFGLISTLHCAGMCGPLAASYPARIKNNRLLFAVTYQTGRIAVYILIGLLVFAVGFSFSLFRMQQVLSVAIGVGMVAYVLWGTLKWPVPGWMKTTGGAWRKLFGKVSSGYGSYSALLLGALNGLLPCGAVYIAALYCAGLGTGSETIAYMGLFGIGTLPVFIAAWLLVGKRFSTGLSRLRNIYRYLPLLVGVLMILRGANLGIPYLSPQSAVSSEKPVQNCCTH